MYIKRMPVISFVVFIIAAQFNLLKGQAIETVGTKNQTVIDSSTTYVYPNSGINLNVKMRETSGLFFWNDTLWTHNDNRDITFYAIDTDSGSILNTIALNYPAATDWEATCQDSDFLYIGDFGNNKTGNRTNLKILKINKQTIRNNQPEIERIFFKYPDQENYIISPFNTDFDCEAFILKEDSLYLFTKQWKSKGTKVYSLPITKGNYIANLVDSFSFNALITDACYVKNYNTIVLTMYNESFQPYFAVLKNFKNNRFFHGDVIKLNIALQFHQIEGITSSDGLNYYVSNERLSLGIFTVPAQIHIFNLSDYIDTRITDDEDSFPLKSSK